MPGPQWAMYLCGAKLLENYPVSMIVDGQVSTSPAELQRQPSTSVLWVLPQRGSRSPRGVADAIVADHQALLAEATKKK